MLPRVGFLQLQGAGATFHCGGFSPCRAWALGARAWLLHATWNLPGPGTKPVSSLHGQAGPSPLATGEVQPSGSLGPEGRPGWCRCLRAAPVSREAWCLVLQGTRLGCFLGPLGTVPKERVRPKTASRVQLQNRLLITPVTFHWPKKAIRPV